MLQLIWFKRDLRVSDHDPLSAAARCGPVLPLYIVEPALWRQPDMAGRHWAFIRESLQALDAELTQLGQPLIVRVGEAVAVLEALREACGDLTLWSHEETGTGWTYARDRAVLQWCRARGVAWHELPGTGVVRGLRSRSGWARRWDTRMGAALATPPEALPRLSQVISHALPTAAALGLAPDPCPGRQPGGRRQALALLDSFLHGRGHNYHREISSPLTAAESCSRLSAHLAWGTLSLREITQATHAARAAMDPSDPDLRTARRALHAFIGRLHWHCHFMQKLESEPRIEFENVHGAYDGLREHDWDAARFDAWCAGMTGLPFVDACMRYLRAHGWINFRMRAMLVAVASYHLWLHWREPALFLARQFTDYEPGIHYSQMQMQSGTTGINTVRIYNPVKQGFDHDADGVFIRRWVPELAGVPDARVHEPWRLSRDALQRFGAADYPERVVDHVAAARTARDRVWAVRRGSGFREVADAIQERHGSRKSGMSHTGGKTPRGTRAKTRPASPQMSLLPEDEA